MGADFKMYFDNKEFGSNEFAVPGLDIESGTDFAARLTAPRRHPVGREEHAGHRRGHDQELRSRQESAYLSEMQTRLLLPVPDAQA